MPIANYKINILIYIQETKPVKFFLQKLELKWISIVATCKM